MPTARRRCAGKADTSTLNEGLEETLPLASFGTWLRSFGNDVAQTDFTAAFEKHFDRIVEFHRDSAVRDTLYGASMLAAAVRDPALRKHFEGLGSHALLDLAGSIEDDVQDELSARGTDFLRTLRARLRGLLHDSPDLLEADGTHVAVLEEERFRNWGRTVDNTPALTCVPRSITGVQNIVRWARDHGKSVRVAGYRHTWSNLYARDGEVLISLLPLFAATELPAVHLPMDPKNSLQGITVIETTPDGHAHCRIGAATTNEQFRAWCLARDGGAETWTLPLNVIMVEITFGGSNAPICHGAGHKQQTLSDLVVAVELVDANGEVQTIEGADLLRAAAGCFGLLGVVTAVTLRLDPMSYAKLAPTKPRVLLAIPPTSPADVPPEVDQTGITPAELSQAATEFKRAATEDYYAEWFWFTRHRNCWVNTWHNDGDKAVSEPYPGPWGTVLQEAENYVAGLANSILFRHFPPAIQCTILAAAAMRTLPDSKITVTPLIEALHFRRGIQNMRVLNVEIELPLPPRADDPTQPDLDVARRAWWAAIQETYADPTHAMRLVLEMRIMGGSNILLAPQSGNDLGTCSIEVLTTLETPIAEWHAFTRRLVERWAALTDSQGHKLHIRPHWAKEWQHLTFNGVPARDYLKSTYSAAIPQFLSRLDSIFHAFGTSRAESFARFGNPVIVDILTGP